MGEAYLRHVRRALDELEVGGRAIRDVQDLSSGALAAEPLALLGPTFATRGMVDRTAIVEIVRLAGLATILPETAAQEQSGLCTVRLTPAIDSRRVALLQRRSGYRSATSRAFVAVAQDYAKAIED